jgi:hypothetical protein
MYHVLLDPYAIEHVIDQTDDLCIKAIQLNINTFELIRNPTEAICIVAVKINPWLLYRIYWLDFEAYANVSMTAIQINPLVLEYVNLNRLGLVSDKLGLVDDEIKAMKSYVNICIAAVQNCHHALKYVEQTILSPNSLEKICVAAIEKQGLALKYINRALLAPDILAKLDRAAVYQNCRALEYAEYQTLDLCEMVVKQFPSMLRYAKFQTVEMCAEAIASDPWLIGRINLNIEEIANAYGALCVIAVSYTPRTINDIKKDKLTASELYDVYVAHIKTTYVALSSDNDKLYCTY